MLSTKIRKPIAKAISRYRLNRLLRKYSSIRIPEEEFEEIVESLSDAMCTSGIFRPRRIRKFRDEFCSHCTHVYMYTKDKKKDWCSLRKEWMYKIKDEYCGGFEEREEKDVTTLR
ncbi:MAG: hypothetical protein IKE41_04640 [Clostridia bacterium]|nr:hypothetical protein [Clostridia bacterium]